MLDKLDDIHRWVVEEQISPKLRSFSTHWLTKIAKLLDSTPWCLCNRALNLCNELFYYDRTLEILSNPVWAQSLWFFPIFISDRRARTPRPHNIFDVLLETVIPFINSWLPQSTVAKGILWHCHQFEAVSLFFLQKFRQNFYNDISPLKKSANCTYLLFLWMIS